MTHFIVIGSYEDSMEGIEDEIGIYECGDAFEAICAWEADVMDGRACRPPEMFVSYVICCEDGERPWIARENLEI